MTVNLESIFSKINPPDKIKSLEHLESLIQDTSCYSVVEKPFFEQSPALFEHIAENNVPGDILVTGVWKGGSSLFLHAMNAYFKLNRDIWLSDTFAGFINEEIQHERDKQALALFATMLAPAMPTPSDVEELFQECNLWGDSVHILTGPLEQTLPKSPIEALSFLHIDVDFYEPTYAALDLAYPKLNPGGFVVIDDYGVDMFNCADAVDNYRSTHGITDTIHKMTDYVAYWQKS